MVRQIEVHVASHYNPTRLPFLNRVLDSIALWTDFRAKVIVSSNTDDYARNGTMQAARERFSRGGHDLILNVVSDLADPWMLTWVHKPFIQPWLASATDEDFFIYIEDDIVLSNDNIAYFAKNLDRTKSKSLIPGFLRVEYQNGDQRILDLFWPEYWQRDRSLRIDGQLYHACHNPYWAGFVLDPALAREYLASASFTPEGSKFVRWQVNPNDSLSRGIAERAAMGLTYENADKRLGSRIVVPIVDGGPDPDCLVWHCANNYSDKQHPVFGRLTVDQAFQTEGLVHFAARKLRGASTRPQKITALLIVFFAVLIVGIVTGLLPRLASLFSSLQIG
jgi:hypothetical protein